MTRGSTSRPRVSVVVSPDADDQVAELPHDIDDPTTWEGSRWIALQAFARAEGVRLPPMSRAMFIATEPLATDAVLGSMLFYLQRSCTRRVDCTNTSRSGQHGKNGTSDNRRAHPRKD